MKNRPWYAQALDLLIGVLIVLVLALGAGFALRPVAEVFLMGWRAWG